MNHSVLCILRSALNKRKCFVDYSSVTVLFTGVRTGSLFLPPRKKNILCKMTSSLKIKGAFWLLMVSVLTIVIANQLVGSTPPCSYTIKIGEAPCVLCVSE